MKSMEAVNLWDQTLGVAQCTMTGHNLGSSPPSDTLEGRMTAAW